MQRETNFEAMRQAVCFASNPLLFDPTVLEFRLTTDVNGVAWCSLLEQRGRQVAFESRKLTTTEQRCATHVGELLVLAHYFKI